jgi:PKD repeat protein
MSDKKFDDKIRESLEGHEPEVNANWGKMKDRIAAAAAIGAIGLDVAGSKIATQLSIAAAVIIGAGTMWLAQVFLSDDDFEDETSIAITIEEDTNNSVDDVSSADAEFILNDEIVLVSETLETDLLESDQQESDLPMNEASDIKTETKVESNHLEESTLNPNTNVTTAIDEDEVVDTSESANEASSEVSVELEPEVVPFTSSTTNSCVGIKVDFVVEDLDTSSSYLWNFGDGSFSSESAPTHTYDKPGVFDVTLSVRPPGIGSIKTQTIKNLVEIHPQPTAVMSWEFPRIVRGKTVEIILVNSTEFANSATWIVNGDILDSDTPGLDIPGKYELTLIASNQFGCQDHVSNTIEVGDRQTLNAPARFSPDGDGRYDTFMPFGLLALTETWQLVISNEEGVDVFVSETTENSWDGVIQDSTMATNGSHFYWTVICTDFNGDKRLYSDIITVER